jgi:CRP-like cAMP-binding protein
MSGGKTDLEANRLLTALPRTEYRRLLRGMVAAPLEVHTVLYEPGDPIEHIYFPNKGCLISLIRELADGRSLSAGIVGFEGLVGIEVFLGSPTARFVTRVVAAGEAFRMQADAFRKEVGHGGPWTAPLHRYLQFSVFQFTQMTGCHRFHPLEQHFCSLLLRLHDHSGREDFAITHELFARLMGVRRAGVTQVARKLQRAHLIRYRWGKVIILDRKGLEERACVCHRQLLQAKQELLGLPSPPHELG